jgi:hypothetical protein
MDLKSSLREVFEFIRCDLILPRHFALFRFIGKRIAEESNGSKDYTVLN